MTRTYIEYFFRGSFVSESTIQAVEGVEDPRHVTPTMLEELHSNLPKACFAYQFFDREEVVTDDGETLRGDRKNESPRYYPGGVVLTPEEVAAQYPDEEILIANAKDYGALVRTRLGNFQPLGNSVVL